MARRTFAQMVAAVQRSMNGVDVSGGEIQQALETAHKELHLNYDWPWSYAEANILIPQPTTTGTLSIAKGDTVVYIAGCTDFPFVPVIPGLFSPWPIRGYRLKIGDASNNVDYIVADGTAVNVGGDAYTVELAQPFNSADVTDSTVTLYKDRFPLPQDCDPGQDIFISQQNLRIKIKHITRPQFEAQALILKPMATNLTMFYTDAFFDGNDNTYGIRFMPPISQMGEYRILYRKRPADFTASTDYTEIPEGYDEVLELIAEARIKFVTNTPGSEQAKMRAEAKLKMMRRRMATAAVDNQPKFSGGLSDSSFSQNGLSVTPMAP